MSGFLILRSVAISTTSAMVATTARPAKLNGARVTAGSACRAEISAPMNTASSTNPARSNRATGLVAEPEMPPAITNLLVAASMVTPLAQKIARQST